MRSALSRLAPLLAASVAASGCVLGDMASVRGTFEETRALDPDGTFVLENTNGRVQVGTWERSEVRIEADLAASSERLLEEIQIDVSGEGDRVEVRTRLPSFLFLGSAGQVAYRVTLPRRARVEVESVNGRLRIAGVAGAVSASTVNGRVQIEGAPVEVDASTINGNIEATYEQVAPAGLHHYSTTNGSVTLRLPSDVVGRFEARTVNGKISSDFPLEVDGRRQKRLHDRLGEGGADYELKTINGSVRIRER